MSALGKGDIREPFLEIVHGDGSTTSDFVCRDFYMDRGKPLLKPFPAPSVQRRRLSICA